MQCRRSRRIFLFACCVAAQVAVAQDGRSVHLPEEPPQQTSQSFEPSQSAALFVGIQRFTHDSDLEPVRYAVDDAIDLAYAVSLDRDVPLVAPDRVALALFGDAQKEASRRRLAKLKERGAIMQPAGQTDIVRLMEDQAKRVGKKGILIVGIATHGFSDDGLHYLVASNSLLATRTPRSRRTSFSTSPRSRARRARSFFSMPAARVSRPAPRAASTKRTIAPPRPSSTGSHTPRVR